MAPVLAVALLLLFSSTHSSAEDVQATITQVRESDPPTPAIKNTTEGSSDSHSAVLASEVLGVKEDGPLVLVDLARADQEKLSTTSATPPSAESVRPGFDMNEFDDDSPSLASTQDEGTLVPGFPAIGSSQENSNAVVTYDAASASTEDNPSLAAVDDNSFAASEDTSFATAQDEGTLVPGFPKIGSSQDNSNGQGYGVRTYDAASATAHDRPSFAALDDNSFATAQDEGTLVPGFPAIGSSQENSNAVVTYDAASASTEDNPSLADDNSFAASEDTTFATAQDEGTLVPGFPKIGSSQDNSNGQGYGVRTYDPAAASTDENPSFAVTDDNSFATSEDTSFAAVEDEGTLVPGFPTIGSSQDNSHGKGYGVRSYDANSLAANPDEYPQDDTYQPGFDNVRPYGSSYGQP